ncbi:tetratricopeptide repeat protein [Pseudomonas sp. XS1P51]
MCGSRFELWAGQLPRPEKLFSAGAYYPSRTVFVLAARYGSVLALLNLGYMHHHGLGTRINEKAALRYYRKAALHGQAEGYYQMGVMFSERPPARLPTEVVVEQDLLAAWGAFLQGARLHHKPSVEALREMTDRLCLEASSSPD